MTETNNDERKLPISTNRSFLLVWAALVALGLWWGVGTHAAIFQGMSAKRAIIGYAMIAWLCLKISYNSQKHFWGFSITPQEHLLYVGQPLNPDVAMSFWAGASVIAGGALGMALNVILPLLH